MLKSIFSICLITTATAHQNFHQFWVNDVTPGYQVGIRMPPSSNPVTDITSNDIACNVGGTSGAGIATIAAKAGDKITVEWSQSTHPGPITHMLYGPVSSASSATGIGSWAKIDELDYVNGKWANEIMSAVGMKHSFKLPSNLASGEYLLRSEMLALHGSTTLGGAQFYIGCAQLKVTGPGGVCSPKISLPGAYKATDNNILIPNFYYGFVPSTFSAPGGPVATCGSGGSSPTATARSTTAVTPSVRSTTTSVATSAATTASRSSTTLATTTRSTTAATTTRTTTAAASTTSTAVGGTVPLYGQCGGSGYTGPALCASGVCKKSNDFYSQCVPA